MSSADLPGFRIIEKIGTGGMATVWKACQLSLDRIVAIKILSPSFTSQPEDVHRFQREAQSAAKLKHPGIVQVYDANADDGLYYFVMEYVAGYTVGDWITRKGVLRESNALLVAECVAEALSYAWDAQKIIHCDIKPDNILVDADGTVKVSDLGLARTISAMSRREEESDEVMGTPYYISPEQALGRSDLDCRADIYSLGAMMFHMLTGKMPFQDEPPEVVMELQVTTELPLVTDLNPEVTPGVADLVCRMVAKSPDDRPDDWPAVLDEIEQVKTHYKRSGNLTAQSDTMRLQSRSEQINRISGRSKQSTLKALLGLFVAVVIVITVLYLNSRVTRTATLPPTTTPVTARPLTPPDPIVKWRAQLADARAWLQAHPNDYDDAMARFKAVAAGAPGTDVAMAASSEVKLLELSRSEARAIALETVLETAAQYANGGDAERAIVILENYAGAFAAETQQERRAQAEEYRTALIEDTPVAPTVSPAAISSETLLDAVAEHILAGRHDDAMSNMTTVLWSMEPSVERALLQDVYDVLKTGLAIDQQIATSFQRQVGQVITLDLMSGTREVRVKTVEARELSVTRASDASAPDSAVSVIPFSTLSYRERLSRLNKDNSESAALSLGLMALDARSTSYAIRYFADTHDALAGRLISGLRKQ